MIMPAWLGFDATAAKFTSTVTVKSNNPEGGLVCVTHATSTYLGFTYTHKKPADPADSEYAAEVSSCYTSNGGGTKGQQRYYLYAKAKPGYKFVRWEGGSTSVPINTEEAQYTYTWEHYTKGETAPGISCTVTAYFVADNDVATETNIPAGVITLDPEAPKTGDQVTATVTDLRLAQPGSIGNKNMMTEFLHWEDEEGNIMSHDRTFTFTVPRPMTLKAIYRTLGEVPQKGKYYRIRNAYNRVLTLEGGYKYSVSGSVDVPHALLRWALPLDHDYNEFHTGSTNTEWAVSDATEPLCPEASPNTIFYVSDGTANDTQLSKAVLSSQGADTKTFTGQTLDIVPMSDNLCGYYGIRASALSGAGFKTVIRDKDAYVNISSFGETDVYSALAVQPIDEEHLDLFWFGASPDYAMQFDGAYWTSMFTAFPYECLDGVEAYYVKEAVASNGETYALITKIESGIVPANSAVLLRCNSLETKENRLLPLDPATPVETLEGNALKGAFQLYTNAQKEGRTLYDDTNMRVLGINADNHVGFFRLAADENGAPLQLKANKAYLDMSLLPGVSPAAAFRLRRGDSVTEIETVTDPQLPVKFEDMPLFDLNGRPVALPQSGQVYITNGHKVIAR